ncbi:hypothetical protein BC827DRAFT_1173205, partial [Russula dissimulans]
LIVMTFTAMLLKRVCAQGRHHLVRVATTLGLSSLSILSRPIRATLDSQAINHSRSLKPYMCMFDIFPTCQSTN